MSSWWSTFYSKVMDKIQVVELPHNPWHVTVRNHSSMMTRKSHLQHAPTAPRRSANIPAGNSRKFSNTTSMIRGRISPSIPDRPAITYS